MTKRRPYLDFYSKHNISPVVNNVIQETHFAQRKALYHRLGILSSCIQSRKVLEFGPGNGANALYTISLEPEHYVLVDANHTGIENCKKNLNHYHPETNWSIVDSLIENFESDEKFDLVICEGVLPNQLNPSQMVKHCASFVKKGGILVITCHDVVSTVSETLRCLPGSLLIRGIDDFNGQVTQLSNFFEPHLANLKGMTRTVEDWVIDNIINTEFWKEAPLFSINEAIESLEEDFIVHTTSPFFLQDWSWYKSIGDIKRHSNNIMKEAYWGNLHNFVNWRIIGPPRKESENLIIYDLCKSIRSIVREAVDEDLAIEELIENCMKLSEAMPEEHYLTKSYIKAYTDGMSVYLKTGEIISENFTNYSDWWGRGMQYATFVKS